MTASTNTLRSRVGALLGVEAGEERALSLTVGLYFLLAASFVFVQTTAYGLFIGEFGARNLPFAYLSIAIFASLLAFIYLKLSERVAFRALAFIDLGFLAAACLLFWLGLQTQLSRWFIFFLPFWFQTIINLANLVVWPLAGRMFDVRQAKRLFGLVGGGNWLANILFGGFVVAPLLAFAGAANLYLFAALAVLAAGFILWVIFAGRMVPAAPRQPAAIAHRQGRPDDRSASPFKKPYNRLIFAYVLLWWVSFYFIDNIFYDRAGAMFPDGAQLAAFIGRQLSVIGVIALITAALLTGRILRRFGLRTSLLVMPLIVIFCTLLLVVAGVLQAPAVILFWVAAVGKTFNVALGFSLSLAVGTLLYQPILGSERNRTQTIAEGIVQPVAIGLAGLLLLLFNTVLHFNAIGLSVVFLLIGGLWLLVIVRLSEHYPRVLGEALVKRSLGEATTLLFDPTGIAQLKAGLKNPAAGPVLYALNQLEQLEPDAWGTTLRASLPDLLAHPAPEVRTYVLRRLHSLRLGEAIPAVRDTLLRETDSQAYAMGVRFLAAMGDQSAKQVSLALESRDRLVRRGAIAGLLESAQPAGVERARLELDHLVQSPDSNDRLIVAEVLAEADCAGSRSYIGRLLADDKSIIRQTAVRAAGHQEDEGLIEALVTACGIPETARIVEQMLVSKGAAALPAIMAALNGADTSPASPGSFGLVRALGSIGGEQAVEALSARMDCPDAELRLQVLQSLNNLAYRLRSMYRLHDLLKAEVAQAAWLTSATQAFENAKRSPDLKVLSGSLSAALRDARQRVMLLLSFGLDARAVLRAAKALDEAGANPPAFAVEAVDAMLPSAWKPLILPLVENITPSERLRRWQSAGIQAPVLSLEKLVGTLVAPESRVRVSRWATLCALHVAGVLQIRSCEPAVRALSSVPDTTISTLSCWSLAEMGFDVPVQGGAIMLSLVEKVLALKSASLFRQTPDDVLADVASQVDELAFDKGETIFRKGDHGDSLYVIVSGRVEVRDGERLLNELDEGAIFGELALLDPSPRSATVKTLEPAHLLQLNDEHFRTVLAERPEVAAAIIHVLTSYIRSLLADGNGSNFSMKDAETFEP